MGAGPKPAPSGLVPVCPSAGGHPPCATTGTLCRFSDTLRRSVSPLLYKSDIHVSTEATKDVQYGGRPVWQHIIATLASLTGAERASTLGTGTASPVARGRPKAATEFAESAPPAGGTALPFGEDSDVASGG